MEKLSEGRKYLKTILNSHAPPEDGQHLPQRLFGEADSNISTLGLHSTHSKANNQAFRKAEMRTPCKKYYKAR